MTSRGPFASSNENGSIQQEVELDLGELVVQGGFHSNFKLTGVRDCKTGEWLIRPEEDVMTPSKSPFKLLRQGSSTTSPGAASGSLGLRYRRSRKGQSKNISGLERMPPMPKSVKISMVSPFQYQRNKAASRNKGQRRRLKKTQSSMDINELFESDKPQEYVLKCLNYRTIHDPELREQGLKDLETEIAMLHRLAHPRLHGTGTMILEGSEDSFEYPILLLDSLKTTLDERIEEWKSQQKKLAFVGRLPGDLSRQRERSGQLYLERLGHVVNIAKALDYLHSQKIIFRALKPENIGFDRKDQVQLKNFGLAKDLTEVKRLRNGLYRLTGLTGSARYMAPEVALEQPYNEACDVYSLALIIWQIFALKVPFGKYSVKKMYQQVHKAPHSRPSLIGMEGVADGWLPLLLDKMWSPLISQRYSIDHVVSFLEEEEKGIAQSYFLASEAVDGDLPTSV